MKLSRCWAHKRPKLRPITGLVAVGVLSVGLSACSPGSASPTTTARSAAPSVDRGWKTYVYEQVAISVPANWHVVTDYGCPEPSGPGTLFLGSSKLLGASCPAYSINVDSVTLTSPIAYPSPSDVAGLCPSIRVNGLVVDVEPCSSSNTTGRISWVVPALGVAVAASAPGGASVGTGSTTLVGRVLRTLRRATPKEVIASSPVDWPTYTYRSAAISVPSSWAVRRDQNCPDTSAEGTLELGVPRVFSGCTLITTTPAEVIVSDLSSGRAYASCPSIELNGQRMYMAKCQIRRPDGIVDWAIPSLGVEVTGGGSGSAPSNALMNLIVQTVRRASPVGD
jgi:hypothetical protein